MDNSDQEWFTLGEAAARLRRSESYVAKLARRGDLRGHQRVPRGSWWFHRDELDRHAGRRPSRLSA